MPNRNYPIPPSPPGVLKVLRKVIFDKPFREKTERWDARWVNLIILIIGLSLAFAVAIQLQRQEQQRLHQLFELEVERALVDVELRLQQYRNWLHGLRYLMQSEQNIDALRFQDIVADMRQRDPSIVMVNFAQRVTAEQRSRYEKQQQLWAPDYRIREALADSEFGATLQLAAARDSYLPLKFAEPRSLNRKLLGYDLKANQRLHKQIEAATRKNSFYLTAAFSYSPMPGSPRAAALFLGSVENDDVSMILGLNFLLEPMLRDLLTQPSLAGSKIQIVDQGELRTSNVFAEESVVYRSPNSDWRFSESNWFEKHLSELGRQRWVLRAEPGVQFFRVHRRDVPWLLPAGMLLVTVLTLWELERRRRVQLAIEEEVEHRTDQLGQLNRELERLSETDSLTHIANRRKFEQMLFLEWRRAQREGIPLSLLMVDVDSFKRYNDCLGHIAGDRCLVEIVAVLQDCVNRSSDLVARYGGEEFVVLLPTGGERAHDLAERCRLQVGLLGMPHPSATRRDHVTISVGVATLIPTPQWQPQDLLERADAALYAAKRAGGDRVQVFLQGGMPAHSAPG